MREVWPFKSILHTRILFGICCWTCTMRKNNCPSSVPASRIFHFFFLTSTYKILVDEEAKEVLLIYWRSSNILWKQTQRLVCAKRGQVLRRTHLQRSIPGKKLSQALSLITWDWNYTDLNLRTGSGVTREIVRKQYQGMCCVMGGREYTFPYTVLCVTVAFEYFESAFTFAHSQ